MQLTLRHDKTNSMVKRVIDAIALYPIGNISGDWAFFKLESGKAILRRAWINESISTTIIERINNLANTSGFVSKNAIKRVLESEEVVIEPAVQGGIVNEAYIPNEPEIEENDDPPTEGVRC